MAIESDRAEPLSGLRHGLTTAHRCAAIPKRSGRMAAEQAFESASRPAHQERPPAGDASRRSRDLAGFRQVRARRQRNANAPRAGRPARVAVGAIARQLLAPSERDRQSCRRTDRGRDRCRSASIASDRRGRPPMHCADAGSSRMIRGLDLAVRRRPMGGTFEGSRKSAARARQPLHWDRKLDGRLARR